MRQAGPGRLVAGHRAKMRRPNLAPDAHKATRFLAAFVAQTTVLTGLLYYFGWAEGQAYFGYFGVATSMLDLGTTDYLLRSVSVAVPPLLATVCVLTAAGIVLPQVVRRASRWPAVAVRTVVLLLGVGASGLAWRHS
jgi:hypothetical protein